MATAQKITRDNYATYLFRSSNPRGAAPNGPVYFDTANDKIQLITAAELPTITYPVGHPSYNGGIPEANPFTHTHKMQDLALYFFILQEVEADPTLQNFRASMDAVGSRMGKLVGATSFLNGIVLDANGGPGAGGTANSDDRDKICDSGHGEYDVAGVLQAVYHGVKSLTDINDTSQPFYQLAASLSTADRQAAACVDFDLPGDINSLVKTYQNGGADNRNAVLIIGVRDYGYTIGETSSVAAGVAELGAYSQGYGIGNSPVPAIQAIPVANVYGVGAIAPYSNLSFHIHLLTQTRTGFAATGAGASGDFKDEIILTTGTVSIVQLRAWLDRIMQEDDDLNANTAQTGPFNPKRHAPLYTIDPSSGSLVTRAGIYINPAKLTAEAQQQIIMTDDSEGQHFIPFNSGIVITVSDAWLADPSPWFRMLYALTDVGGKAYDTATAVTVPDANGNPITEDGGGAGIDSRLSGNTLLLSYAFDTETAGGEVSAGSVHSVYFQLGGVSSSKRRTVGPFDITRSSLIQIDASTDAETN